MDKAELRRLIGKPIWIDALAILLLGACTLKSMYGFQAVVDLGIADEALYLTRGVELLHTDLDPQWAPLYSAWYFLLHGLFGQPDNVQLHDLSNLVLIVLGPVLLYVYLRRVQVMPVVALIVATLYLVSFSNLGVTPFQGKFAVVCLLLGLMATTFLARRYHAALLLITLLLLAYVRPEYAFSFVLAAALIGGAVVYRAWQRRTSAIKERSLWLQAAGIIGIALVLALLMGNPLQGGRSDSAFKQHFAINYVSWGLADYNPWSASNFIAQQVFRETESIPRMALNNPAMFARHMWANAGLYPQNLATTTVLTPYLPKHLVPAETASGVSLAIGALLLALLAACVVLNIRYARRRQAGRWHVPALGGQPNVYAAKYTAALLGLILVPSLAASLLIYPRYHYLQIQALLLLILLTIFVANTLALVGWSGRSPARSALAVAGAGVVLWLMTPNLASGWSWPDSPTTVRSDVRSTVSALRSLDIQAPVRFLSYTRTLYSFNVYLGSGYTPVDAAAFDDFQTFLRDREINMIIWPDSLRNEQPFGGRDDFKLLLEDPAAYGFAELIVPDATWKGSSRVLIDSAIVDALPLASTSESASDSGQAVEGVAPAGQALQEQHQRAEALLAAGQVDEAIALYRELVAADPSNRSTQMALASVLVAAERDAEALAEYEAISARWPDFPWAHTRRGQLLERQGDLAGAIGAFESAVQLAPDDPNTRFVLAYAYRHAGRRDQAIAAFEAALALDPGRAAARKVLEELKATDDSQ